MGFDVDCIHARYVDDQLFCLRTKWTSTLASYAPYRAPFDTEFELILNLAVGGDLPGRIVDDTVFPATMLVDYVRCGAGRSFLDAWGGGGTAKRAARLRHGTIYCISSTHTRARRTIAFCLPAFVCVLRKQ